MEVDKGKMVFKTVHEYNREFTNESLQFEYS